jgi:hypothetical protein
VEGGGWALYTRSAFVGSVFVLPLLARQFGQFSREGHTDMQHSLFGLEWELLWGLLSEWEWELI